MTHQIPPAQSLVDAIDASLAGATANQNFLTVGQEQLSYDMLGERMARFNRLFRQMGLNAGDRVTIVSDDDTAVVTIFFALLRAGLTAVVGDGKATPDELVRLITATDPAALIADATLLESAGDRIELPDTSMVRVLAADGANSMPGSTVWTYPDFFADFEPLTEFPEVPADALVLIMFTSGTTYRPKGVSLTHANLNAQLDIFGEIYGFNDRSRILNILPLHHVDGLIRGPLAALRFGGQVYRPMRFSIPTLDDLLANIPSHGITHFITVPAMLNLINRLADPGSRVLQSPDFRFVICSADYLEPGLWTSFEERFGTMVVNAYGLSEIVCDALFCGPEKDTRRVGTLGKPVNCQARVVDEFGGELKNGEVGELILSGPIVMQGYFRQPDETARVLRDGWFYTGDLVSRDPDGFFTFEGRKKTVVISGGTTIHPENITTVILGIPGVTEAVSFGVPDPIWGQRLVTCVVTDTAGTINTAEIIDYCRERLAPEKLPSEIHFLDALPRGPSGKVIIDAVSEMVTNNSPADQPTANDIYAIASECFQLPADALSPDSTPYNTEGWDSLAHIAFIVRLEESFGIALSPVEIIELGSLADAESIVARAKKSEL